MSKCYEKENASDRQTDRHTDARVRQTDRQTKTDRKTKTEREVFDRKSECYEGRKQRQVAQLLACPLNDPGDNRIITSFITPCLTRARQTDRQRQTDRNRQTEKHYTRETDRQK